MFCTSLRNEAHYFFSTPIRSFSALIKPTQSISLLGRSVLAPALLTSCSLEERVKTVAIETMQGLCGDFNYRMKGCSEDISLLDQGVFYPHSYFKALNSLGNKGENRKNLFLKKGHFYHGIAPSGYFSIPRCYPYYPYVTGKVVFGYTPKKEVPPSDALKAMITGLSFLDCTRVCKISYYAGLLDVLGNDRFNALFTGFTFGHEKNPIAKLISDSPSGEEFTRAQMVYVSSATGYHNKHPYGASQGYSLLCLNSGSGEKISFLGFGLPESGVSLEQVKATLLTEFNEPTFADDILHERHKDHEIKEEADLARSLDSSKITEQEFVNRGGGNLTANIEFDFEKVDQLVSADTNETALNWTFDKTVAH